jgi:23S rRNA (cytidine1920-2'-O)/16S rRNA (cytidine1409-2'-O)-methyltransferase
LALLDRGLLESRGRARALIMAGKIFVNERPVDKPGTGVCPEDRIVVRTDPVRYVSRGGLKLENALKVIGVTVRQTVCLDVGASTGGFTDCLLQHGAKRVYAVDVGYGQLAWKLRQDPRVVVIERTNIRAMKADTIPEPLDLITIDVSFISLKIVVPSVLNLLKNDGRIIALIKPQFEVGRGKVGKGGVVRDPELHDEVIQSLTEFFIESGLTCGPVFPSALLGPKGNREFMIDLTRSEQQQ